jgi:hypothetical protein
VIPQRAAWLRLLAAAVISSLVGAVLLRWEWFLNVGGFDVSVERSATITFEYWLGIPIAALLGYLFSKGPEPLVVGILLMWGATSINHIAHISRHGVPNMWPVELALLMESRTCGPSNWRCSACSLFHMLSQRLRAHICSVAWGGTMPSNNALERTVRHRGLRVAAARATWPAAQRDR